eukprot:gnl/TRDRNA2_/TRDRNA2_186436_c0_seq1.p1 gnl/TRDRNA2_/TRDRNA2_186436_c0~~gnl/TRDRNA2_/TRDRNA2_186436_c0_seq1.p1  ORF type:complete len:308 (+),score=69.57 gnl/TRDRNA2_/TRDRNA2_186436_c0_seq1:40-963(+)
MRVSTAILCLSVAAACGVGASSNNPGDWSARQRFADDTADRLLVRLQEAEAQQRRDLDGTTLGKPSQLAISVQGSPTQLLLPRAQTRYNVLRGPLLRGAALRDRRDVRTFAQDNNPLKKFGQGAVEKMLGVENDPEMEKRMVEGNMNFDDLVKSISTMDRVSSMSGALKLLPGLKEKLPSKEQMEQSKERLTKFKKIIDAMDDDERADPDLLFDSTAVPERIPRIAQKSGEDEEMVMAFLQYFKQTRSSTARIAKGEDPEKVRREIAEEQQRAQNQAQFGAPPPANRAQRRMQKKREKKMAQGGGFR